jgi:hypothetical protein
VRGGDDRGFVIEAEVNEVELFWRLLTYAALAWYVLVTAYVAVRGAADIRTMLADLARRRRL